MGHLAHVIAVPEFQRVSSDLDALEDAVTALCEAPDAPRLEAAQAAWRDARASWIATTPYWFGPVTERRARTRLDWGMVDYTRIETTIAQRDSTSAEDAREFLPATVRGLGAIEHLLFGDPSDLTVIELEAGPRCEYLVAITQVAAAEGRAVSDDWTNGYAERLAGEADASLSVDDAVNFTVGTQVHLLRRLADMEIGPALGTTSPDPIIEAIPGDGAAHDTEDYRRQVGSIESIYLGPDADGSGLTRLVRARSADADERVRAALEDATGALAEVDGSLKDAAMARTPEILRVYQTLKALQLVWNTEVVSLLGVTVGFSDADGDSG